MKYIIKYEICDQVSPDDFRMVWREKIINEETTISEIIQWFEEKRSGGSKYFPEMRLTRPDN